MLSKKWLAMLFIDIWAWTAFAVCYGAFVKGFLGSVNHILYIFGICMSLGFVGLGVLSILLGVYYLSRNE